MVQAKSSVMGDRIDITLHRTMKRGEATVGVLSFNNGKQKYFTLEPQWRDYANGEKKVMGESAIPAGCYKLQRYESPRFGKLLPLLLGVPGFGAIEIHTGNYVKDTQGCILVGETLSCLHGNPYIEYSRLAHAGLMLYLNAEWGKGNEVWLTVDDSHLVDATTV